MQREPNSRTVAKLCAKPGCGRVLPTGRSKYCSDACYKGVQVNRHYRVQVAEEEANGRHLDRVGNVMPALRPCLGCKTAAGNPKMFWSNGPGHRFCPACSTKNENTIQPGVRRARVVDAESGWRPIDHLPRGDF